MTSTAATKTYFVRDTTRAIVLTTSNPHEVAAFLGNHKPNDYVVEGGSAWSYGGDWLVTYEDFRPWLRDEPLEPAAEGADGPDGDDGTAETVAPGRKIDLDTQVYCPWDTTAFGEATDCDHDYEAEPVRKTATSATWKCTRCGGEFTVSVWE